MGTGRARGGADLDLGDAADGGGRATDEGHARAPVLVGRARLRADASRPPTRVAECVRRERAAGIAVDAAVVDVQVAPHVLGEPPRRQRHAESVARDQGGLRRARKMS